MRVFKFGGASVKEAEAVRNVAAIIRDHGDIHNLLVVVSAMGKTTNALEQLLDTYFQKKPYDTAIEAIKQYHLTILKDLFEEGHLAYTTLDYYIAKLKDTLANKINLEAFDEAYDQVVSFGELISTNIIHLYLNSQAINSEWVDARQYIKTNNRWREGKVDLVWSESLIQKELVPILSEKIVITQGFLGGTIGGKTTTLGREGSDYSAALFAACLKAASATIWKDVPGILNADPKLITDTKLFEYLTYKEAAEMTFYGAHVIHPKTIKPLANKTIPLYVRSFVNPEKTGTCINGEKTDKQVPSIIFKFNQILVTFKVKDLTFITEQNLSIILNALTKFNIKINLMQSTAISFSICTENNLRKIEELKEYLQTEFEIIDEKDSELITILNYDTPTLDKILANKKVCLEQKTQASYRAVVKSL